MIFDSGHICTRKKTAKSNYSFHGKLKVGRALVLTYLDNPIAIFDFSHFQGVNWGQNWNKTQTSGTSCLFKNWSFSRCFEWHLDNYEDYLWSKFQLYLTLFTRVIASKSPSKWSQNQKKQLFLLGKVENGKYPEAETWYTESIDGWSYYRLCENFW